MTAAYSQQQILPMASGSDMSPSLWVVSAGVARPDVRPSGGDDDSGGQKAGEESMPKRGTGR